MVWERLAQLRDGTDRERRYSRTVIALSFGGVAFLLIQLVVGSEMGLFPIPGRDVLIWDRVGDAVRSGLPIYYDATPLTDSFWYAPPLAILFAGTSWLPIELQHWLFVVVRILALRVIGGSWIGAGLACWFPLVALDMGGGNFNLPIAACIVAAIRGRPQLAVWGALAKLGPAFAVDLRDWRKVLPSLAIAALITLPWLHLWPEWFVHIFANLGSQLGPEIPLPFAVRLVAALGLVLLVRTRWSRGLAAAIAIPAFYWGSLVVLIAPVAIFLRDSPPAPAPQLAVEPA